ncbi:hypothetical protein [Kribbella sp. NPDC048928]|uniref:hypothetical protein n=1 Tax=Kribbella sp. NPDC048928 TaxID=3364111 RepID=UPI00371613D0
MNERLDGLELLRTPGALDDADAGRVLATLTALHRLRSYIDEWEPILVGAARDRGATWAEIAPRLGLASRQAAERRYLRLKPHSTDDAATTREDRVQAARDRRSGDRAVAGWAHDNAAALRQLAGQITALPTDTTNPSTAGAAPAIAHLRDALGSNNAADLLQPLTAAGEQLRDTHPDLAGQVTDLTRTIDAIRMTDLAGRTPALDATDPATEAH